MSPPVHHKNNWIAYSDEWLGQPSFVVAGALADEPPNKLMSGPEVMSAIDRWMTKPVYGYGMVMPKVVKPKQRTLADHDSGKPPSILYAYAKDVKKILTGVMLHTSSLASADEELLVAAEKYGLKDVAFGQKKLPTGATQFTINCHAPPAYELTSVVVQIGIS